MSAITPRAIVSKMGNKIFAIIFAELVFGDEGTLVLRINTPAQSVLLTWQRHNPSIFDDLGARVDCNIVNANRFYHYTQRPILTSVNYRQITYEQYVAIII